METETLTTIPPTPDNSRAKADVLAAAALGTSGTGLKTLGVTSEGYMLLEDLYGRHYTRDYKGTIRCVESKKA